MIAVKGRLAKVRQAAAMLVAPVRRSRAITGFRQSAQTWGQLGLAPRCNPHQTCGEAVEMALRGPTRGVLRFAPRARGDQVGTAEAERLYHEASAARVVETAAGDGARDSVGRAQTAP